MDEQHNGSIMAAAVGVVEHEAVFEAHMSWRAGLEMGVNRNLGPRRLLSARVGSSSLGGTCLT